MVIKKIIFENRKFTKVLYKGIDHIHYTVSAFRTERKPIIPCF